MWVDLWKQAIYMGRYTTELQLYEVKQVNFDVCTTIYVNAFVLYH